MMSGLVGIASALGLAGMLTPGPAEGQQGAAPMNRKVFTNSVTPLPSQPGLHVATAATWANHKDDKLDLVFSLPIPKAARANLEARVAKGEIVPPAELARDYAASPADHDKLVAYLKAQGFEVTRTTADRTSVYAKATVAQIEKSLQVKMARVTSDGITYNAASTAPSLPNDVGAGVHAIIGLQPFRRAHKNVRVHPAPGGDHAVGGVHPSANVADAPPYLVREILEAYNADKLAVNGAGEKIAILIDTLPLDSDLVEFWRRNKLPVTLAQVEKINVKGVTLPKREVEETLDVEWTTGIAPGATVRVYASSSLQFVDLDLALDRIIADLATEPAIHQLSISLGLGESFMGGADGEVAIEHQKFLKLAAAGVNVFISTGDAGSHPDASGQGGAGPLQVEYESSDPFVIAVGGTRLDLDATTGKVASEVASPGSGGGRSVFFGRPAWQKGAGVLAGTDRLVPDVSLAADPERGALVIYQGETRKVGGTSWAAPTWAGFCALLNESRSKAGVAPLPFLNPLIYPLLGSPSFRDITQGGNGATDTDPMYLAGPGYDLVTGLGVPNVRALMGVLSSQASKAAIVRPAPRAIATATAESSARVPTIQAPTVSAGK